MARFDDLIVQFLEPYQAWLDIDVMGGSKVRVHPEGGRVLLKTTKSPANIAGKSWTMPFEGIVMTRDQAKALMLAIARTLQGMEK